MITIPIYDYIKDNKTHYYYAFEVKDKGKRKTIKERGFKTKAKAKAAEAEARTQWNKGEYIAPNKILYKDYIVEWLDNRRNISIDTKYYYQSYLKNHILPSSLANEKLSDITVSSIDGFIGELTKKGVSETMIHLNFNVINSSLNSAVRKKIIPSNPARYADKPRIPKKDMKYWTADEVITFLNGFEHRYKFLFFLAIYTGMRIGEILGLRNSDIDLENRKIYVRQILISRNKRLKIGAKTVSGNRPISISNNVVDEIIKQQTMIKDEKISLENDGKTYYDNGLLICTRDGKPLDDSYARKLFLRFIEMTSVPVIRIHDLRHTFASLLLRAGVHPKIVQEMLGHSTIKMTMDKYSHLMPNMQADAANVLDNIIKGDERKTYQNPTNTDDY